MCTAQLLTESGEQQLSKTLWQFVHIACKQSGFDDVVYKMLLKPEVS